MLDERGELKVKVMKDADGFITQGLVVDESDYDHVALIVASIKGISRIIRCWVWGNDI